MSKTPKQRYACLKVSTFKDTVFELTKLPEYSYYNLVSAFNRFLSNHSCSISESIGIMDFAKELMYWNVDYIGLHADDLSTISIHFHPYFVNGRYFTYKW